MFLLKALEEDLFAGLAQLLGAACISRLRAPSSILGAISGGLSPHTASLWPFFHPHPSSDTHSPASLLHFKDPVLTLGLPG